MASVNGAAFSVFVAALFCGGLSSELLFNAEEIHSIQYDVRITGDPIVTDPRGVEESSDGSASVTMTNKFGQKYKCLLPPDQEDKSDGTLRDDGGADDASGPTELSTENLQKLLAPMKDAPCLIRTKDWWTYEFCYGTEIRQYHMEEGKPSGGIMFLGRFEKDYDWSKDEEVEGLQRVRYHSQFYSNGSECDLTGTMRKTEVRFECEPNEVGESITRVDEPQSCEYIITVSTPKICPIQKLRPVESPKPKEISCSPMFTQDQYERYKKHVEAEGILTEKRKLEAAQKQKEEMLKLVEGEDISGIDLETEEGMAKLESMAGEKMADKLMLTINEVLGKNKVKTTKPTMPKGYEELQLASGEKKSIPKKVKKDYNKLVDEVLGFIKRRSADNEKLKEETRETVKFLEKLKEDVKNSEETGDVKDETSDEVAEEKTEPPKSVTDLLRILDPGEKGAAGDNEEKTEKMSGKDVEIKFNNLPNINIRGIPSSESEMRVVKHLENSIKQKLSNSKLDVKGHGIEVKVITGSATDLKGENAKGLGNDDKQLQGLLYNMMIGNQDGYNEIGHQMTSEHNYKFDLNNLKSTDDLGDSSTEEPSKQHSDDASVTQEASEEEVSFEGETLIQGSSSDDFFIAQEASEEEGSPSDHREPKEEL